MLKRESWEYDDELYAPVFNMVLRMTVPCIKEVAIAGGEYELIVKAIMIAENDFALAGGKTPKDQMVLDILNERLLAAYERLLPDLNIWMIARHGYSLN